MPPYDVLGDTPVLRETLRRLADTGVSVLDVEFLRFEPETPIGIPEGFLEAGARLGAKYVLVMSIEPEEARTLDRFGELCDRAAQYGLARLPRVRDLHRREDPRARRAHGEAVGSAECVDPGGCAALQPLGRDARRHRARRSVALPLRADLRRGAGHAHRAARSDPRGADRAAASGRGRAAARRTGAGAAADHDAERRGAGARRPPVCPRWSARSARTGRCARCWTTLKRRRAPWQDESQAKWRS